MDRTASRVLSVENDDLLALSLLLFGGPMPEAALSARLDRSPTALRASLGRLERAGYVHEIDEGRRHALTEHAQRWIATIWEPMRAAGNSLCERFTAREIALVSRFLESACRIQEHNAARVARLLAEPSSRTRGGLSPAALRRVQVFVEGHLAESIRLADLALRAELSPYHFARAFKASAGTTPRAYVEARRIAAAERLIRETDLPLSEIALEVGLGSQSRLTTAFRRATGLTPALYRRKRAQR